MPRETEPNLNNALGSILRKMLHGTLLRSENTQVIRDNPGLRPDILIASSGRSPVVIETEYHPALNAEAEARERLGLSIIGHPRPIEAAIALRYPVELSGVDDLRLALSDARLSYCVFTQDAGGIERFPESGWLRGSVGDLSDLVRLVSVPQKAVDAAADALERGIDRVAAILDELDDTHPGITIEAARLLGMVNVPQTRRMACAILANALIFHERIAGMPDNAIKPLSLVCGPDVPNPKRETLAAWADILKINYWPIFAIGRDILQQVPSSHAARILCTLELTVEEVASAGIENGYNLTGRVFQRLIADRKYLATFYTRPASAALLARLAVAKMEGVDWSDSDSLGNLRIGDFACGTGALLSAVYEQLAARHEQAGGASAGLHRAMMEDVMYGCDVMPSAIHITGSTLSGSHPSVGFGNSRLYTLPYGKQEEGSFAIGSLELLQTSSALTLFNTTDPAMRTGSAGEETASRIVVDIPDDGFDMVIMNPPFTSNTKHYDAEDGVVNAAFAAFDATPREQSQMADRLKQAAKQTSYHGHAGLASAFASLADKKLRSGGVVALVLPFTAVNGSSWSKFRDLIATKYTDLTIVSIASNGRDISFSSDTGIAECLVIGRKLREDEKPSRRAKFISLRHRPDSLVEAAEISKTILSTSTTRRLEDGPYGGNIIYSGTSQSGEMLDAPISDHKNGWGAARILDASAAQVAYFLSKGDLWLPAKPNALQLPVARLNRVGRRGVHHQLLVSDAHKGPFIKAPPSPTATYPSLYNHSAKDERFMVCDPDLSFRVKPGMEKRGIELWTIAGRAHLTLDFRFTSQPLAAAFTEYESMGGTAWPNVNFPDTQYDYPFALWCNSTLGLLLYWWHASRQQDGRGRMTVVGIETLPILDFRALSDEQLATAQSIFDEFRDKELQPAYLADADPNRAMLDRRVVCDLLGFDGGVYEAVRRLAAKWCAEPSVHGGKARPQGAGLAI